VQLPDLKCAYIDFCLVFRASRFSYLAVVLVRNDMNFTVDSGMGKLLVFDQPSGVNLTPCFSTVQYPPQHRWEISAQGWPIARISTPLQEKQCSRTWWLSLT
jgi:hypothetical protein